MKVKFLGVTTAAVLAAAFAVMLPQTAVASTSSDQLEIKQLKLQLSQCKYHRMHRRHYTASKQVVVQSPVILQSPAAKEIVVEKQVFVDRPINTIEEKVVEKQVLLRRPVEFEQRVIVEHSKHRMHLLHLGIPFIGVNLF